MDCSKDEDIEMTDEENVLQSLINTEFQENIVITADNNTNNELIDSRSVELEEENTNIESFVDRECINVLNFQNNLGQILDQKSSTTPCIQNFNNVDESESIFHEDIQSNSAESSLATDSSENIINVDVNLLKDFKHSEDSNTQNKLTPNICIQINHSLDQTSPITPCVQDFYNKNESKSIFHEGIHNNAAESSLATDNCENNLSVDVNLFKDIKPSEDSDIQDKLIPIAHRICSQMNPNYFETRSVRKLEEEEQTNETSSGQRNEACCEMQEVSPFRYMTAGSVQTFLIQPQDIADQKRNKQISDSSVESMSATGYSPENRKKKTSNMFYDDEQIFNDKMLCRHEENCETEWTEDSPIEIKSKRLKICNSYASPYLLASNLLISPLTSIEQITDSQFETNSINDVSDVQDISNSESLDENTSVNCTENSVCSQSTSDINTLCPMENQCFIENEAETENSETLASEVEDKSSKAYMGKEIVLKNGQLLNENTKSISEHNILVTSTNQEYELDSNSKVTEEKNGSHAEKNEKSSNRCYFESLHYSSDSVTTIITDIRRDSEEMSTNKKIKTTECITMEGICPSSTKSPQDMNLLKSQNWENEKNQQVSDSLDELMDTTGNSKATQKRKFSANFLENEQQLYNAKTLRSFKIKNKRNLSKQFQEATNLGSKSKSLQICRKQALVKPSKSSFLTNSSKSFESDEVLQLESDEQSLEKDEYHKQIESNIILKSTTTINSKNMIKHTENCKNVPKNILDSAANCLQGILSYIENDMNESKTPATINPNTKLGHTSITFQIAAESESQEVLTDISNNTFDETKSHKIKNSLCSADTEVITTENCNVGELKMNEISSNETIEEMFHSGSKHLSEESTLTKETNSIIQDTSLNNISATGSNYTLIKLYLENIEDREFTVENVVNFIQEHDPSMSYFSALHATRIFLKNALRNEMVKMINGYYLILPTENSTKHKSTLKFHLKKMINRQYSDIQTIKSLGNNNLEDNKAEELRNEDTTTKDIIGRIAETNSHDTTPNLEDKHGSEDVHLHEKYLQK